MILSDAKASKGEGCTYRQCAAEYKGHTMYCLWNISWLGSNPESYDKCQLTRYRLEIILMGCCMYMYMYCNGLSKTHKSHCL